jgi:large subunit ribosomal protein L9
MKVILKQDIRALGKKGDLKEVAEGYARNYLLPKGLAVEATSGNVKTLSQLKEGAAKREQHEEEEARAIAAKLKGLTVNFKAKVGDGGRLFGSITAKDVADQIQKSTGLELDKRKVEVDEAIKSLGNYQVKVHIYKGITVDVTIAVTQE